jgi:hypothetical protein
MRSLAKPVVMRNAALAAALCTLACWPRLALWLERREALWFLLAVVCCCSFFLWDFVFAWQEQYGGRPVFQKPAPQLWLAVTLAAIAVACAKLAWADPVLRPLRPDDFPKDFASLGGMTLFSAALVTPLLLFAPFAFFLRLTRSVQCSSIGTVLLGMFVAWTAAGLKEPALPPHVLAGVVAGWATGGAWGLVLYHRGGAALVWWWGAVVQARHLAELL